MPNHHKDLRPICSSAVFSCEARHETHSRLLPAGADWQPAVGAESVSGAIHLIGLRRRNCTNAAYEHPAEQGLAMTQEPRLSGSPRVPILGDILRH